MPGSEYDSSVFGDVYSLLSELLHCNSINTNEFLESYIYITLFYQISIRRFFAFGCRLGYKNLFDFQNSILF